MDADESESYLSLATEQWVVDPELAREHYFQLLKLSGDLAVSHRDPWLKDFLLHRRPKNAGKLLGNAINLNRSGDADHAHLAAMRAERAFENAGSAAGSLRSSFENLYALGRTSKSGECLSSGAALQKKIGTEAYPWLQTQILIELSSCEVMAKELDRAVNLSDQAVTEAAQAGYVSLELRALAMRGKLQMEEGHTERTWHTDLAALEIFWRGTYPDERAFQLYHDLQFNSESSGLEHLRLLLQRETVSMITGHGRFDFEAMAHFQMAEAAEALGDVQQAQNEMELYQSVLNQLPAASAARQLYQAYSEIGLASLATKAGLLPEAATHLHNASSKAAGSDNVSLQLEYLQARAEYERDALDSSREQDDLRKISQLILEKFQHTVSKSDRWHMRRVLDYAQRRLLEIRLSQPHTALQTFAQWHSSRMSENPTSLSEVLAHSREAWAQDHLDRMTSGTLLSFAILPNSVIAWAASREGVREKILPIDQATLRHEVRVFYLLCSDPHSDLQKVNASGLRLYQMLIAPLDREFAAGTPIWISADSFLSWIPWAALRTGPTEYWGQMHTITIHSGFQERTQKDWGSSQMRHILIATPGAVKVDERTFLALPAAEKEARSVAAAYPQARRLNEGEATASRILAELRNAEGFHFAGHAITRSSGGELITDEDAAHPILNAPLLQHTSISRLRLVVLSACSTAPPESDADEDPDGLLRSFVAAGVPFVIASRWDVDSDATAQFMNAIYHSLKVGQLPARAIEDAAHSVLLDKRFNHPYYWSAFQVFGMN